MRTSKITTSLAVTALIVAVLGTTPLGHAAGSVLPRGSVGTPQIKKSAVSAAKLRNGSVTGTKVLDGSLTATDFKAGSLPAGPKGDKGDKGDTGATGPSDVYTKVVNSHQIGTSYTEIATLTLQPGQYLVTAKLFTTTNGSNIPSTIVVEVFIESASVFGADATAADDGEARARRVVARSRRVQGRLGLVGEPADVGRVARRFHRPERLTARPP